MKKYVLSNKFCYIAGLLFILSLILLFTSIGLFPRYNLFAYILVVSCCGVAFIFLLTILIFSLQTVKIDKIGIIQQNPLRDVISMKWDEIKSVEIINFIFKAIYISNANLTSEEKVHLSPYREENGIIKISYSKKILKEIKKYYNKDILTTNIKLFSKR